MLIHKVPTFITQYMLIPSQPECMLLVLLLLVVCRKSDLAFKSLLFVAFCIVVNVALKVTFQVPSHMTTAKGFFAFPSGHMQFSTVFYGWIIFHVCHAIMQRRKHSLNDANRDDKIGSFITYLLYFLLMLVFLIIGYGLVVAGYHSFNDVIAGWFVGSLLVLCIGILELVMPRYIPLIITCIASTCMLYIPFQYAPIPQHAWWAYGMVLLLSMHWICSMYTHSKTHMP